jgi:hypothetical protein
VAVYASQDDVLARAGRVGGAFSVPGRQPTLADVDAFLVAVSAEIDEAIRARGFDPASLDSNAKAALLDLAAYGALARALRALGDRSPEVLQILVEADAVWASAMGDTKAPGSISDGTFPVIAALLAGAAGGGAVSSAGSFWGDETDYGRPDQARAEANELWGTNLAPGFSRGQRL